MSCDKLTSSLSLVFLPERLLPQHMETCPLRIAGLLQPARFLLMLQTLQFLLLQTLLFIALLSILSSDKSVVRRSAARRFTARKSAVRK